MRTFAFLSISVFILAGCMSSMENPRYAGAQQLVINKPITVPAGSSYAYVKAVGQVVRRKEIDTYELYCKFLLPRPKESGEYVITPDTFQVLGIYNRTAELLPPIDQGVQQVAFSSYFRGGGGTQVDLELHFKLFSANQPLVKGMTCIRFGDAIFYNIPKLEEVKEVLGDLAEFQPAQIQ